MQPRLELPNPQLVGYLLFARGTDFGVKRPNIRLNRLSSQDAFFKRPGSLN